MSQENYTADDLIRMLYRKLLKREPDATGLEAWKKQIKKGTSIEDIFQGFLDSAEYKRKNKKFESNLSPLPPLWEIMPEKHKRVIGSDDKEYIVFVVDDYSDFDALENAITDHAYYDRPGIWNSEIDQDKLIMADIALFSGATNCLDYGCFNGPILSVLKDKGISVTGVDLSHLAFLTAFENIRKDLFFGDLLNIEADREFDFIFCLDILEHINPNKVGNYVNKLASLLQNGGRIFINSPMYGVDRRFGGGHRSVLPEWTGDELYRSLLCDKGGWPEHGHLIFAAPIWWERLLNKYGLVRNIEFESIIFERHLDHFEKTAGRRPFFVLEKAT